MFVTSRRMWARLSRALVVVLLAVLLAWGMVYLQNSRAKPSASAAEAASPKGSSPVKPVALTAVSGKSDPGSTPASGATLPPASFNGSAENGTGGSVVKLPPLTPMNRFDKANGDAPRGVGTPANIAAVPVKVALPPAPVANPLSAAQADALLADAKAKLDAGDLVAARNVLNDAIVADRFPATQADNARALQSRANEKLIFSPQPYAGDTYTDVNKIERSDGLRAIARSHAVPWEFICRMNGTSDKRLRLGQNLKAPVGPFHAVVNKAAFRIDLFLGGLPGEPAALYVTSLAVGLGKDNSTPTGQWEVVLKTRNPPWINPRSGEHFEGYDPKNPLGGYWVALKGVDGEAVGKTGYGIHGTIDPDSIGKQASMGCVRLRVEDIQLVYDMLNDKSRVLVRD